MSLTFPAYVHILDSFKAEKKEQMSLKKGEIVRVLRADDGDDFFYGEVLGKSGFFPNYYGEIISEDQIPKATKDMFKKLDKQKEKEAAINSSKHGKTMSVDAGSPTKKLVMEPSHLRKSSAQPVLQSSSPLAALGSHDKSQELLPSVANASSPRGEKSGLFGVSRKGGNRESRRVAVDVSISQPAPNPTLTLHKRNASMGMRRLSRINAQDEQRLYKGPTFGVPLAHLMFVGYDEFVIPPILRKTIAFLVKHLDVEGIFRISGSQDDIADWKRRFNAGEPVEFVDGKSSPHDVAGLLKAWLRELPEPLLTFPLFDDWMAVAQTSIDRGESEQGTVEKIQQLLQKLPEINRAVLTELFLFLKSVSEHSAKNLMTAENIGVVIGPNILQKENQDALTSAIIMPASIGLTAFLVTHCTLLFGSGGGGSLRVIEQQQQQQQHAAEEERPSGPASAPLPSIVSGSSGAIVSPRSNASPREQGSSPRTKKGSITRSADSSPMTVNATSRSADSSPMTATVAAAAASPRGGEHFPLRKSVSSVIPTTTTARHQSVGPVSCRLCAKPLGGGGGGGIHVCSECKKEPYCDACCKTYVLKSLGETTGRLVCSLCISSIKSQILSTSGDLTGSTKGE